MAQLVCLIARAAPGLFTEDHILYHLPPERARSYLHTALILRGVSHVWPHPADNPAVAWWQTEILPLFNK